MKSIAMVPLAVLSILIIASSQDWVKAHLNAQLAWNPRSGFDLALHLAVELPFGHGL